MAAFRRIARCFSRSRTQLEKNVTSQPQVPEAARPVADHTQAEPRTGINPALAGLWRNVRYTIRQLQRSPGFALTAVLALALGVGPNVAIFSIIWATFFAPFPYPHAEQLVVVWTHHKGERGPTFSEDYAHYAAESHSFQRLDFQSWLILHLTNPDHTQDETSGLPYSPGMNTITMGDKMALGRDFLPDEGGPGNDHLVVLYHYVWAHRYHSDPDIIGKYILIENEPYRVVGVVKEGPNERAGGIQFCVPIRVTLGSRVQQFGNVMGRLKPGVTIAQARAELTVIDRRLAAHRNGGSDANAWSVSVEQLRNDWLDPKIQRNLWLLLAAVGLVLLIACANVANLLLARGGSRKQELAVRSALGATRRQIFVQLLTESVTLALMGGLIGIAMGWGIMKFSKANFPDLVNQSSETVVEMNIPVLCFALGVTLIAGVLFGCAPGWQARRLDISDALKRGSRSAGGRGRVSTQSILVTIEIALALTLLAGAGMALHSFWNLTHIDLGFTVDRVLTARLQSQFARSPDGRFVFPPTEQIIAQQRQLLDCLRAVPGVADAALASNVPLHGFDTFPFAVAGQTVDRTHPPVADFEMVSTGFFNTFGIRLVRGRFLGENDTLAAPFAVMVNETFVRRFLPNVDPLTQRLTLSRLQFTPSKLPFKPQFDDYQVVGVFHDVLDSEHLTGTVQPQMVVSLWQIGLPFVSFAVHTAVDPIGVTPGIRAAIASVSSGISINRLETMQQVVSAQQSTDRFGMFLFGAFAAIALLLAAVGIYGVMAFTAAQRTHEIGVRMALGAVRREVVMLIVRRGMRLALIGIAIGLAGAYGLGRVMHSTLYGVQSADVVSLLAVAVLLFTVALAACWLPARRSARTDPMQALRGE
jgi:putative ABC transport system permease protein